MVYNKTVEGTPIRIWTKLRDSKPQHQLFLSEAHNIELYSLYIFDWITWDNEYRYRYGTTYTLCCRG